MKSTKYRITLTEAHSDLLKVEITDKHCSYVCVYEPSIEDALAYASYWLADTEARHEAQRTSGRAILEMQKLDREAGILKGNYDGLD
tara:strand:+ start:940 stop:1200 length:261 start_codon:yes stop_codon:yes gene_type:complete